MCSGNKFQLQVFNSSISSYRQLLFGSRHVSSPISGILSSEQKVGCDLESAQLLCLDSSRVTVDTEQCSSLITLHPLESRHCREGYTDLSGCLILFISFRVG